MPTTQKVILAVYLVGIAVDYLDSRTKIRMRRPRAALLAFRWPVTLLVGIYGKAIR